MVSPRRIAAIAVVCFTTTTPLTFAAGDRPAARPVPVKRAAKPAPQGIVVPDVSGQAYVFAEGILEDAGLAWYVKGRNGYAGHRVLAQSPKAGTVVLDTGAPLVTLTVEHKRAHRGRPDNRSPYRGTAVRVVPRS